MRPLIKRCLVSCLAVQNQALRKFKKYFIFYYSSVQQELAPLHFSNSALWFSSSNSRPGSHTWASALTLLVVAFNKNWNSYTLVSLLGIDSWATWFLRSVWQQVKLSPLYLKSNLLKPAELYCSLNTVNWKVTVCEVFKKESISPHI